MRGSRRLLGIAVLAALTLALPYVADRYLVFIATLVGAYVVAVQGLNILQGLAGQISIGHAGFCAIGAYVAGLASIHLELPFLLSVVLAVAACAVVGFILGCASIPLAGPYLALATIGFGLIVNIVAKNWVQVTGGPDGLTPLPPITLFGLTVSSSRGLYFLATVLAWLTTLLVHQLIGSRVGRAMMAIRDDPIAASCSGVDVTYYRLLAFVVSSAMGGLGGILIAYISGGVFPDFYTLGLSGLFLTMVVLGGSGTAVGPVLGTAVVVVSFELFRGVKEYQMVLYSILVILVLIYQPSGLVGLWERLCRRLPKARLGANVYARN